MVIGRMSRIAPLSLLVSTCSFLAACGTGGNPTETKKPIEEPVTGDDGHSPITDSVPGTSSPVLPTTENESSRSMGGTAAAENFWKVFVQGDIATLQDHYADEVVLRAGSEFQKKEWGINESGDRSKDTSVTKSELMKAYSAMLAKIGTKKWRQVFGGIAKGDMNTKTLENEHVLLTVRTGPGAGEDDAIQFEFALDKGNARWQVVSERTDY